LMSVRTLVKSIQDIMRQDVGVDGDAQRISQLCWMFFLKIIDDQDQELELLNADYRSPIPKKYQWRTWAADPEGITGDELLDFVNDELFPALKDLTTSTKPGDRRRVVKDVFEDAYNYMKSGQLMRQVINKINGIDSNNLAERQHFGDTTSKSSTTCNRRATRANTTRHAPSQPSWQIGSTPTPAKSCSIRLAAPVAFSPALSIICASTM
jgi:type I restriction-modification system DNA methylase subunit